MLTIAQIKAMSRADQIVAMRLAVGRASRAKTIEFRRDALADYWYLRRYNTSDTLDRRMKAIEAGRTDPAILADQTLRDFEHDCVRILENDIETMLATPIEDATANDVVPPAALNQVVAAAAKALVEEVLCLA